MNFVGSICSDMVTLFLQKVWLILDALLCLELQLKNQEPPDRHHDQLQHLAKDILMDSKVPSEAKKIKASKLKNISLKSW